MRSFFTALIHSENLKPLRGAALYASVVATVGMAGLLQSILMALVGQRAPFLMFFPAVILCAWFSGWRAGFFASVLSVVTAAFLFSPSVSSLSGNPFPPFLMLTIYFTESLIISALGEARLQSRRALLNERNSLEERVAQRTQEITTANEKLAAQIAEREKSQVALSESESRFRSVVETATDAIVMSDADGNIIFWNRGAQEMFGYRAEDVLQQSLLKIIPTEFQEAHSAALTQLQAGAAPRLLGRSVELRGRRSDGSEFPLELAIAGWQMDSAQFYSGIMRDLTQRKQAEEDRVRLIAEMATRTELEAAEQHYRLLAEAIPQIVWTALPDGTTDYFNQHWFNYTGLSAAQSLGEGWERVLHPEDKQRTLEIWKQATDSGDDYEIEYRFRRYDGVYHWYLGRGVPLRDDAGRIYKWFGTCTAIDAQKRTEAASRFLAQAMIQLTASLDEAAIVQTLADLCAPAIGNWCVVDLVESAEAEARTHFDALTDSPQVLRRAAVAGSSNENQTIRYQAPDSAEQRGPWRALLLRQTEILRGAEIELLTHNGGALSPWRVQLTGQNAAVMCVPLIARGRALGIVMLLSTNAAHNLDETNAGLIEDLARNAALMVDNARLLHEMQEANRAKDEFLAVLSHELRTPLTAILGWVQLLSGAALDEETRQRALSTIERNTYAQVQLIEDLLDLSRIVTGKLRLEMSPLHLEPIIEAAMDAARPAAQAKEIELFASLSSDVGLVMGDAHRLQQVLWNLLSNAVKFTPKGGRVEVSLQSSESSVEIAVCDSGLGIRAEFLPYVFDRFRQADSSSTRQHGGLGLGLAIVRHVTELHGGTVQAESEGEDKGTSFKITLPIAPKTTEQENSTNNNDSTIHKATSSDSPHLLNNVRVLLVDDERDAREMLSAALRRYGAQVQTCASVSEALTHLPDWQPHVLVSDIGMPGEDGYDLIRQVRALPSEQNGNVPAMALTAYARTADCERALEAGFNRHVVKPVDPATLASHVADLAGEVINNR